MGKHEAGGLAVAIVLTPVFNAIARQPSDETATADYFA
jgi:hypothetical protein